MRQWTRELGPRLDFWLTGAVELVAVVKARELVAGGGRRRDKARVYFLFYRPSLPKFLEIEKKIKEIFFNFIFLFPSDSCSSVMFFRFVFSITSRLIKLPPVTALGEILPF